MGVIKFEPAFNFRKSYTCFDDNLRNILGDKAEKIIDMIDEAIEAFDSASEKEKRDSFILLYKAYLTQVAKDLLK